MTKSAKTTFIGSKMKDEDPMNPYRSIIQSNQQQYK